MAETESYSTLKLTAEIVAAHVGANSVPAAELPTLIQSVYNAMNSLGQPVAADTAGDAPVKPSKRDITKSVQPDHLISFIDGKRYTMLKRHLSLNGHTPERYREAYGLPRDYPMVSNDYAEKRRALAKAIGLGRKPADKAPEKVVKATAAVAPKRARKPKTISDAIDAAKEHLA